MLEVDVHACVRRGWSLAHLVGLIQADLSDKTLETLKKGNLTDAISVLRAIHMPT